MHIGFNYIYSIKICHEQDYEHLCLGRGLWMMYDFCAANTELRHGQVWVLKWENTEQTGVREIIAE